MPVIESLQPLLLLTYPHIDPIWFRIPFPGTEGLPIRWYSLAYIAGILLAWWYLVRLISLRPGAPLARRHADDLITWATLGVILGGRIAYVLFYDTTRLFGPEGDWLHIFRLWEGGMSFHGGLIGVTVAMLLFARTEKLNFVRMADYVACTVPFGLFFGRLANFINGELWGRTTDVPWAMVFPGAGPLPRHPSQLYEAAGEGLLTFILLTWLFWRTSARLYTGLLSGVFLLSYGLVRFMVEFVREPDAQLHAFALSTGMSMGQWLTMPMILGGAWLVATAHKRPVRA